jgi:hypothetical protein
MASMRWRRNSCASSCRPTRNCRLRDCRLLPKETSHTDISTKMTRSDSEPFLRPSDK